MKYFDALRRLRKRIWLLAKGLPLESESTVDTLSLMSYVITLACFITFAAHIRS